MSLTKEIRTMCNQICDDEFTRLRLEEELLTTLVRSQKQSLKSKNEAFERMRIINRRQLELLGGNTSNSTRYPRSF